MMTNVPRRLPYEEHASEAVRNTWAFGQYLVRTVSETHFMEHYANAIKMHKLDPCDIVTFVNLLLKYKCVTETEGEDLRQLVITLNTTPGAYTDEGYRATRTDAEKAFLAEAVEWTAKNGDVHIVDIRPEATLPLGFHPNERVVTPYCGLATVIGVFIDGRLLFELVSSSQTQFYDLTTREAFEEAGFRAIRTDTEKRFATVAVEWSDKTSGAVYMIDSRPEATLTLGFFPNERIIAPCGLANVIGVDIDGRLLVEVIKNSEAVLIPLATKDEHKASGYFPVRTHAEKAFLERATEWTARNGVIYTIDTHGIPYPQENPSLPFRVNEQVITPFGLGTFVGIEITGGLLFDRASNPQPKHMPTISETDFKACGSRVIRTESEKKFAAVAVDWAAKDGIVYVLETRRQALLPFGLIPNEQVITPSGLATVIGVDIDGDLFCDLCDKPTPYISSARTKEELDHIIFTVRTKAVKNFVSVAVAHHSDIKGEILLLDTRPETLAKHGFSDPHERFFHPQSANRGELFKVAGFDVHGMLAMCGVSERVLRQFSKSRSELLALGWHSRSSSSAAPTRKTTSATTKAGAPPLYPTAPAPVVPAAKGIHAHAPARTVTLSSGAVYRGAHTRAGQRHGNGTMRSADRSWRYKGQWQQGRPHGSGTLWMTIESGRGTSTEAVYEGRWVLGVPHGRGTLRVESVSEKRRYRGRWTQGRRLMTAAEVTTVRLSGGTAFASHRPLSAVPSKSDASKKRNQVKMKKTAPTASARPPAAVVFATHDEVARMVAAVAVACAPATRTIAGAISLCQNQSRTRALQQFLLSARV